MTHWNRAIAIWPGLASFDLPADPITSIRYQHETIARCVSLEREKYPDECDDPRLIEALNLLRDVWSAEAATSRLKLMEAA